MSLQSLTDRIRGEYYEMPGLRLTLQQACRLWQVDSSTCEHALAQLVREHFLYQNREGTYAAQPTLRQVKAQLGARGRMRRMA